MDFVRELRGTALRLLGVMLIGAAIGIPIGAVMLARTDLASVVASPTDVPAATVSSAPLPQTQESASPSPTGAFWVPSGSYLADGTQVGYWTLPDGYRFRGTPELSQHQVFDWANRLRREGERSDAPQTAESISPGTSPALSQIDAGNALGIALFAAFCALFPVGYLYRAILGTGSATKERKYAAFASISSAPLCLGVINALLLGLKSGYRTSGSPWSALFSAEMLAQFNGTAGRIIGFAIWAAIITGVAYAWGWFVENRARIAAMADHRWGRVGVGSAQRSSAWIWLAVGALVLLGYCLGGRDGGSTDGCHVEWDGRMNPTVCD